MRLKCWRRNKGTMHREPGRPRGSPVQYTRDPSNVYCTGDPRGRPGIRDTIKWEFPMLLLIDNYDSFTYNLYQYLAEMGIEVQVRRNDMVTLREIAAMQPDQIVISPG